LKKENKADNVIKKDISTKPTQVKGKKKLVIWVVVVFIAFFFIIARYSYITQLNYDVAALEKSIIVEEATNSGLSIQLDKLMNLPQIRYMAQTQLGMQKPDNYQTVFIEVPRCDKIYQATKPDAIYDKVVKVFDSFLVSLISF